MKKIIWGLLVLHLLLAPACSQEEQTSSEGDVTGKMTISGAWALYPMAVKWAEEFHKLHSNVIIDVSAGGAGKGMADALSGAVDLGMVSRSISPAEIEKGVWWVSVVKDAVVPTINESNPFLNQLLNRGITKKEFEDIWVTGSLKSWDALFGGTGNYPIHVFTRSDACGAAQTWASYLGYAQEDLLGVGVYGDPGLAEAVRTDKLAIGYNNINYAYDRKTKKEVKGIRVVPIDLNTNNSIEKEEEFYGNLDEITQAIATGNYPSPPARDLHFVSRGVPSKRIVVEFIRWVLTEGQSSVSEGGYIKFPKEKLREQLEKLGQ
jgi:phosphate transport system substrate-binding protein